MNMAALSLVLLYVVFYSAHAVSAAPLKNVMLITFDDLRPETADFNRTWVQTPNLNALGGTRFTRAYVQAPQCTPTRTSFLTGLRPDRTRVFTNGDLRSPAPANATMTYFRQSMPNGNRVPSLASWFKTYGYHVFGAGKVFPPGMGMIDADAGEASISYSQPYYFCMMGWTSVWTGGPVVSDKPKYPMATGCGEMSKTCEECLKSAGTMPLDPAAKFGNSTARSNCAESCYVDYNVSQYIVNEIKSLPKGPSAKPWMLTLGMRNPHLPWYAPVSDFDAVEAAVPSDHRVSSHPGPPLDAYLQGDPYDNFEFWLMKDLLPLRENISGFPEVPVSQHPRLRVGYWSALRFSDRQIGNVINTLKDAKLYDDLVIAVVGDHGYGLGELGSWGKYTLLEQGVRAYMTISVPGFTAVPRSDALVEFVDLFPTLADAAGLPIPEGLDGISLMPILNGSKTALKSRTFSQYPAVHRPQGNNPLVMGAAMRTESWRYVTWCHYDFTIFIPDFSNCVGSELYSYDGIEPDAVDMFDHKNLVFDSNYTNIVEMLHEEITANWPKNSE